MVDAAKFAGVGIDVHQGLLGDRRGQQRIAIGGVFPQPRADRDNEVGALHALGQAGIDAQAEMAAIVVVAIVHQVLAAEAGDDRQGVALGKVGQGGATLLGPAGAADNQQRPFRRRQQAGQGLQVRRARRRQGRHVASRLSRRVDEVRQHVFGQGQHHRPGAARGRHLEGARDIFGNT